MKNDTQYLQAALKAAGFTGQDILELTVNQGSITIKRKELNQQVDLMLTLWLTFTTSVLFTILLWKQQYSQISLTGPNSIASYLLILGTISGLTAFTYEFCQNVAFKTQKKIIFWRNFPSIILSFTAILATSIAGFFEIIKLLFSGASFDKITTLVIFMSLNLALNYLMALIGYRLTIPFLRSLFTVVIIGGVVLAMATNQNLHWWQYNLSYLGTNQSNSWWQFNLTLILAAGIFLALIDFIFVFLPKTQQLIYLRIILSLIALNLAGIGLFPNNPNLHFWHVQVANFLVIMIIILIVLIKWLLPNISSRFLHLSILSGVGLIGLEILFQFIGYLSLTVFEISAFSLAFAWLILLFDHLFILANRGTISYELTLKQLQ